MLLENLIPTLPESLAETYLLVLGIICGILLIYAVFVEAEHRRDLIRIIGAGGLFWYATYIDNMVFMFAMGGVFLASAIEFFEIMMGLHKHGPEDLKKYKKMWRVKKERK